MSSRSSDAAEPVEPSKRRPRKRAPSSRTGPGFVPGVYPKGYVPDANWTPTPEQRGRLRYYDFWLYWLNFHENLGTLTTKKVEVSHSEV